MAAPLVQLVQRLPRHPAGGEVVAVEEDGSAWLWVTAPADAARGDLVGSFRSSASDAVAALGRQLVAALGDGRDVDDPLDDSAPSVAIDVTTTAGQRSLAAGTEVYALARQLLETVIELALPTPVAAVRWSAAPLPDAGEGRPGLALVARADGTEATSLLLDVGELVAQWSHDGALAGSQVPPRPVLGLVDPEGDLLDGLVVPARILPRHAGALALDLPPPAGTSAARLLVRGRITLVERDPDPAVPRLDVPSTPFEALTPPVPVP